jgi:hypothetical protein
MLDYFGGLLAPGRDLHPEHGLDVAEARRIATGR